MMAYECQKCLEIFSEPDTHTETESDGLNCSPHRTSTYWNCPACGSELVEEVHLCETCNEAPSYDSFDDCLACMQANPDYEWTENELRAIQSKVAKVPQL